MKQRQLSKFIPKRRRKSKKEVLEPQNGEAPRITNETVAVHREEVLSSARKYIYPLQHSKHKIVLISTALFIAAFISFFTYCVLAMYRFQTNSSLVYGVSQVVPF